MQQVIYELYDERTELWLHSSELWNEEWAIDYYDPAREAIREKRHENDARIEEIGREIDKLRNSIKKERRTFRRPTGRAANLINRKLGPLPLDTKIIHPTKKNLAKVRSYWLLALLLVIGAVATLIALVRFVPWMRVSPVSIIFDASNSLMPGLPGLLAGIVVVFFLIMFANRMKHENRYQGKFWDQAAMFEEQWFRTGAESWTFKQRLYSCIMFSLVHAFNIIYPIASLLVVGLVGVVFMSVYLHVYKRTGSTKRATLSSAKLHATYNRFAIIYTIVAILLFIAYNTTSVLAS